MHVYQAYNHHTGHCTNSTGQCLSGLQPPHRSLYEQQRAMSIRPTTTTPVTVRTAQGNVYQAYNHHTGHCTNSKGQCLSGLQPPHRSLYEQHRAMSMRPTTTTPVTVRTAQGNVYQAYNHHTGHCTNSTGQCLSGLQPPHRSLYEQHRATSIRPTTTTPVTVRTAQGNVYQAYNHHTGHCTNSTGQRLSGLQPPHRSLYEQHRATSIRPTTTTPVTVRTAQGNVYQAYNHHTGHCTNSTGQCLSGLQPPHRSLYEQHRAMSIRPTTTTPVTVRTAQGNVYQAYNHHTGHCTNSTGQCLSGLQPPHRSLYEQHRATSIRPTTTTPVTVRTAQGNVYQAYNHHTGHCTNSTGQRLSGLQPPHRSLYEQHRAMSIRPTTTTPTTV